MLRKSNKCTKVLIKLHNLWVWNLRSNSTDSHVTSGHRFFRRKCQGEMKNVNIIIDLKAWQFLIPTEYCLTNQKIAFSHQINSLQINKEIFDYFIIIWFSENIWISKKCMLRHSYHISFFDNRSFLISRYPAEWRAQPFSHFLPYPA